MFNFMIWDGGEKRPLTLLGLFKLWVSLARAMVPISKLKFITKVARSMALSLSIAVQPISGFSLPQIS